MIVAAFGCLPVAGALTQEVIDVAVIVNALRSSDAHDSRRNGHLPSRCFSIWSTGMVVRSLSISATRAPRT